MRSTSRKIWNRIRIILSSEEFSNNKLDKDVQSIFFPLNLMQLVVLGQKCRIKNNRINPNHCFNKVILFCGMVTYLMTYMNRFLEIMLDENFRTYVKNPFLFLSTYFDHFFYMSGFILNFIISVTKTKDVVNLILTYQKVNRILKDESSFKGTVTRSWIYVGAIFAFYLYTLFFSLLASFNVLFNTVVVITLDANLIYTMVVIKLLTEKVKLWNARIITDSENDCNNKMFDVYVDLLKCYDLLKNVFQQSVSQATPF
ncbi:hypothetical protein B5X24_HaOG200719 [Helicoverpa armigera]|uniref:Gustatory receptor n=1 Tax=Helicoverpa armigera TaxID=29058 RepID=A0A2W1BPT8_HELAM|nr:hypothetical protein B5X24_HaOG200719 [Helicoverpa armigera]